MKTIINRLLTDHGYLRWIRRFWLSLAMGLVIWSF